MYGWCYDSRHEVKIIMEIIGTLVIVILLVSLVAVVQNKVIRDLQKEIEDLKAEL